VEEYAKYLTQAILALLVFFGRSYHKGIIVSIEKVNTSILGINKEINKVEKQVIKLEGLFNSKASDIDRIEASVALNNKELDNIRRHIHDLRDNTLAKLAAAELNLAVLSVKTGIALEIPSGDI